MRKRPRFTLFPYTTLFRSRTARNLPDVRPTLYFNVPAGWAALLPLLEDDDDLARAFLERLRLGFFAAAADRKSTRLNSSHMSISYAVFCLKIKIKVID